MLIIAVKLRAKITYAIFILSKFSVLSQNAVAYSVGMEVACELVSSVGMEVTCELVSSVGTEVACELVSVYDNCVELISCKCSFKELNTMLQYYLITL